jgi:fatty-acyl-CoA synthase
VNLPGLDQVRDRLAAAGVLARRGMVDPVRPDQALRAFVAMRRYGAFGGLISSVMAGASP